MPAYEFAYGQESLETQAADLQSELDVWRQHFTVIHSRFPLTCFLSTQQLVTASKLSMAAISTGEL